MVNLGGTQKVNCLGTCFGGDGLGHREKPIDSAQVRAPSRLFGYLLPPFSRRKRTTQTPAASHPTTWMTGALHDSCIWLKGCSRKPYPPHIHGNVLPPTVEPPASTPFRPPPRPTALPTFRHARVPATVSSLAGARSSPSPPRASVCAAPS